MLGQRSGHKDHVSVSGRVSRRDMDGGQIGVRRRGGEDEIGRLIVIHTLIEAVSPETPFSNIVRLVVPAMTGAWLMLRFDTYL